HHESLSFDSEDIYVSAQPLDSQVTSHKTNKLDHAFEKEILTRTVRLLKTVQSSKQLKLSA
ncbi:MAG TPA: hypothetical protein VGH42_04130, partial [Verrucomicrobiae bacterium]